MLFNSIDFAVFLPIVFILYWFVFNKRLKQNRVLLAASYVFYGWWDWRFLLLIIFSTLVDYLIGLELGKNADKRKRLVLLCTSILVNLGLLAFFKYYNFFLQNFVDAFLIFGKQINANSLNIILPIGISFYTFQTLSYTIDIYNNKLRPTKDLISFSAFVSFFPQLVAGPIEKAKHLLPQFYEKRKFVYANAVDGLRQILWGLFKKIVIADNCAKYANIIFENPLDYSGSTLVLGAVFFTFQIYGDFSGYSDIAIGTSRLFGFQLTKNFNFPYFSRDIAEFWRRWHISLSTWFRDYLYIPLGGSRAGTAVAIRNVFIIFIVSGFWHGANWTFLFWGALNAIYFLPLLLTNKNRKNLTIVAHGKFLPSLRDFISILTTFSFTVFSWIFFRSNTINDAFIYINGIFSKSLFTIPIQEIKKISVGADILYVLLFLAFFVLIEWIKRDRNHPLEVYFPEKNKQKRWLFYYVLILLIILFQGSEQNFIYFQF